MVTGIVSATDGIFGVAYAANTVAEPTLVTGLQRRCPGDVSPLKELGGGRRTVKTDRDQTLWRRRVHVDGSDSGW